MMPTAEVIARGLVILHQAVPVDVGREVLAYLAEVPEVPAEVLDRTQRFAFTRPLADGAPIVGRAEACAGDPIWADGPRTGVTMPSALESLRDQITCVVSDTFRDHRFDVPPLTSVYVDRYDEGGHFVPHTDREIYGPVVVGASLGNGWGTLTFADGEGAQVSADLFAQSVYLMAPPLRLAPWTHSFKLHQGQRWAVTYRSVAGGSHAERSTGSQ